MKPPPPPPSKEDEWGSGTGFKALPLGHRIGVVATALFLLAGLSAQLESRHGAAPSLPLFLALLAYLAYVATKATRTSPPLPDALPEPEPASNAAQKPSPEPESVAQDHRGPGGPLQSAYGSILEPAMAGQGSCRVCGNRSFCWPPSTDSEALQAYVCKDFQQNSIDTGTHPDNAGRDGS